ncbi:MAG: hypothetical protein ACRDST_16560 [Pseudonocardiaceae bacterium]
MSAIAYVVAVVTASTLLTLTASAPGADTKPGGESAAGTAESDSGRARPR